MGDRSATRGRGSDRGRGRRRASRWLAGGAAAAAALGIGCTGQSGSCGGPGAIDGVYVSTDPAVTMDVLECDGEVSGTLTIAGHDYELTGTLEGDEFEWGTDTADFCDTLGFRRFLFSQSRVPFIVDDEGDGFTGAFRMNDQNCETQRTLSRGYGATFERS